MKYILAGLFFGFVAVKSEVVSWFRILEIFHFDSFHMYGIIGSAVVIGIISIQIIKRFQMKDMKGEQISVGDKEMTPKRYIIGGSLFGLGWALVGACPGPMYALVGNGYWIILVPMFFAFLGTMTYGMIREKLPH
tara:strand:+ start:463 stop:867 length:405 start_codon:yes stop_codon:yes gene_type:complete